MELQYSRSILGLLHIACDFESVSENSKETLQEHLAEFLSAGTGKIRAMLRSKSCAMWRSIVMQLSLRYRSSTIEYVVIDN